MSGTLSHPATAGCFFAARSVALKKIADVELFAIITLRDRMDNPLPVAGCGPSGS